MSFARPSGLLFYKYYQKEFIKVRNMALWGNKDLVGNAGTVTINLTSGAVTGAGTTFATAGFVVSAGDVLVVGAGVTYGHAVFESVSSNTAAVVDPRYLIEHPTSGDIVGASIFVSQLPVSSILDSSYAAPDVKSNRTSSVFGVDVTETQTARTGNSQYLPQHAGWVGLTTYTDMHGNLSVKSETLVTGSTITGDAADDSQYPDS